MNLKIIEKSRLWWSLSLALTVAGAIAVIGCLATFGTPLKLGLDFVGGTRLQLQLDCPATGAQPQCQKSVELADVRAVLNAQNLGGAAVQLLDVDSKAQDRHIIAIRSQDLSAEKRTALVTALEAKLGKFDAKGTLIDTVGPVLGQQVLNSGVMAVLLSLLGIVIYLRFRFQWDYAIFAVVALIHDVLITIGAFAALGWFGGTEIDTLFIVALLTIIGFSVNDTVVIYDRVRENIAQNPTAPIDTVVNDAVNQTLTRSLNTTASTLLSVVAIFLFGGSTLRDFSLALIIGFISGAYSSIFIASTLLAWWRSRPGYVPPKPATETETKLQDSI
ncbi:MAG: protein translocase subunit SecF [Limnothrix sp. CACIAM 69d]|nr:MAG: protein translocase subunit SecF [Limnothrix sp. CACIAM 69d]